jgi:hypothetical protein
MVLMETEATNAAANLSEVFIMFGPSVKKAFRKTLCMGRANSGMNPKAEYLPSNYMNIW